MSNPINNNIAYPFLENRTFIDYYGVLLEEFDELLSRSCNLPVRHLRELALSYYNGYTFENKCILNTWSVMNFLEQGDVRPFWIDSGVQELKPENACDAEIVRDCFKKLISGHSVQIKRINFSPKSFKTFYENFSQPSNKMLTDYSPLMEFYFQQGYLKIVDSSWDNASLTIPNEEIRTVFLRSLLVHFKEVCGIEAPLINDCIVVLRTLNAKDDAVLKRNLTSVAFIIDKMCNKEIYRKTMNEAIFHDLFFAGIYAAGFLPTSEVRVYHENGLYTIYDMCSITDTDFGVVCEFKEEKLDDEIFILHTDYLVHW